MARLTYDVMLDLDKIICYDEADGCGDAEPYLWTVFFRIGGDDVTIILDTIDFNSSPPKPIVHLSGSPFMLFGKGSHGNLGTRDVDAGDTVTIPASVGQFEAQLKPIVIPQELKDLGKLAGIDVPDDLPGLIGVVTVLMEEDEVTDEGAEAGHGALNGAIRTAIQQIIKTRSFDNPGVSEDDIKAVTDGISSKVSDAIESTQNWWDNLWSWVNPDDQIGQQVFLFTTDDLAEKSTIYLRKRWKDEGDWEIRGELISTPVCPADAIAKILDELFGSTGKFSYDRETLSYFRDHEFTKYRGAFDWYDHARQHKMQLISLMLKEESIRNLTLDLFLSAQKLAKSPSKKIPDKDIKKAIQLVNAVSKSKNRRTQIEANRVLDFINRCKGKTVNDVLKIMDHHSPSRYHRRQIPWEAANRLPKQKN